MMYRKKLNEVYKEWLASGGIFKDLNEFNVPWKGTVSPVPLDIAYHGGHSGSKKVSPLVNNFIADGELSPASRALIAGAVYNIYAISWAKEYATLSAEYNPIENYNMKETMTDDVTEHEYGGTRTRTDNLQHAKTGTERQLDDERVVESPAVTTLQNRGIYGFNSGAASPSDTQTETASGTNTTDTDRDNTTTYNVIDADTGTQTDAHTGTDTDTRNYELTRSGNIGVTTSQQMLQSERDLWLWNFFRDVVFADIDKLLTLSVY